MSEGAREAGRLTVFLSYSRDDLNFADQLEAALQSQKYDVAIDRQGISGGEDWKARLGGLIRDADTVIFVLSPSSAGSELCKWEAEEASRLGKRIIPVPCRPLGDATVPPQLSALNYIFFYAEPRLPGSGFGTGLARLVSALDTDLDWLRERTRLLQRASEWDSAGRPNIGFSSETALLRPKCGPSVGRRMPPSRLRYTTSLFGRARKPRREGKTPSASSLNRWRQRRPTEPRRWRKGRRLRSARQKLKGARQNKHGAWCGGRGSEWPFLSCCFSPPPRSRSGWSAPRLWQTTAHRRPTGPLAMRRNRRHAHRCRSLGSRTNKIGHSKLRQRLCVAWSCRSAIARI